jgi:hypothetical protein
MVVSRCAHLSLLTLGSGLAAWSAGGGAVASARPDELALHPEPGTVLSKTFRQETDWRIETFEIRVDGTVVEGAPTAGEGRTRREIAVSDEYAGVDDERVLELVRTFSGLSSVADSSAPSQRELLEVHVRSASRLQDQSVRFTWDGEGYDAELEDQGDAELLEGLAFDMDFAAFLPEEEVEEDAQWELGPEALEALVHPGGRPAFHPEESTPGGLNAVPTMLVLVSAFINSSDASGALSGEAHATWLGSREEDGRELGTIAFEVDASSTADRSAELEAWLARAAPDEPIQPETLAFEVELVGAGQLVWDVAARHFVALSFEGELSIVTSMAWKETWLGDELAFEAEVEVSGTTRLDARAEAE